MFISAHVRQVFLFVLMLTSLCLLNELCIKNVITGKWKLRECFGETISISKFPKPTCFELLRVIVYREHGHFWSVYFHPRCVPDQKYWKRRNTTPNQLHNMQKAGFFTNGKVINSDAVAKVVSHWQSTLPPGIQPVYPDTSPQIFFHGRMTNLNENDLLRNRYWYDSPGYAHLTTTALTEHNTDITAIFNADKIWRFLVVFKLKKPLQKQDILIQSTYDDTSSLDLQQQEHEKRVIGYQMSPFHPITYWIFTKEAQKRTNHPLQVVRVYELHDEDEDHIFMSVYDDYLY